MSDKITLVKVSGSWQLDSPNPWRFTVTQYLGFKETPKSYVGHKERISKDKIRTLDTITRNESLKGIFMYTWTFNTEEDIKKALADVKDYINIQIMLFIDQAERAKTLLAQPFLVGPPRYRVAEDPEGYIPIIITPDML